MRRAFANKVDLTAKTLTAPDSPVDPTGMFYLKKDGSVSKRRARVVAACGRCGGSFVQYPNGRPRFCSMQCGREIVAKLNPSHRVARDCPTCGKAFTARPTVGTRSGRGKFCSRKCGYEARQNFVVKPCLICGKLFRLTAFWAKLGSKKYCSRRCYEVIQKMKRATKDDNHDEIAKAFLRVGASVIHTHAVGRGFPDLLVCFRNQVYLVEIKNPNSYYGRKGLNELQKKLRDEGWPVCVIRTCDEAMALILKRRSERADIPLPLEGQ